MTDRDGTLSTQSSGVVDPDALLALADAYHVRPREYVDRGLHVRPGRLRRPAGDITRLRPALSGLAPCVWEAAVLAHERDAYSRHVLQGHGEFAERIAAWRGDVLEGEVR